MKLSQVNGASRKGISAKTCMVCVACSADVVCHEHGLNYPCEMCEAEGVVSSLLCARCGGTEAKEVTETERLELLNLPATVSKAPLPRIASNSDDASIGDSKPKGIREKANKTEESAVPIGIALPPLHLLDEPKHSHAALSKDKTLRSTSRLIECKLADFGIKVKVQEAIPGPVLTRYLFEPKVGVKHSQVIDLAIDLARALSQEGIHIFDPEPGDSRMVLEVINTIRQTVYFSEIVGSKSFQGVPSPLPVVLGKDIAGNPMVIDLAEMPNLLVAGTTGSGRSVGIDAMVMSLLYKSDPKELRLILVDNFRLSIYKGIPHLLAPVITDMKKAANALHWCVGEVERRHKLMLVFGVRSLANFNAKIQEAKKAGAYLTNPFLPRSEAPQPLDTLPQIVVVIDELADLMTADAKVEELIVCLAQKARTSGIHMILATQRPSMDVITKQIKASIPARISFHVSSKIESRIILDQMGAETLLGQGDMLFLAPGANQTVRAHGALVSEGELQRVVEYLKREATPDCVDSIHDASVTEVTTGENKDDDAEIEDDPMYDLAVEVVLKTRRPSISLVQRHLRIGYNRAARLIEQMERAGLVSSMNDTGSREVVLPDTVTAPGILVTDPIAAATVESKNTLKVSLYLVLIITAIILLASNIN